MSTLSLFWTNNSILVVKRPACLELAHFEIPMDIESVFIANLLPLKCQIPFERCSSPIGVDRFQQDIVRKSE